MVRMRSLPLIAEFFDRLSETPVIGVLRGCPTEHVIAIARAAASSGIQLLEVTLDTPDAAQQIELICEGVPEAFVGAGTVRSRDQVDVAVLAGARFVVGPSTRTSILARAADLDIPCVPGAATASEIEHAIDLGATAVKIFPAEQLGGPAYLKALRAPLHGIPLLPSGGVDTSNAASYLAAGAVGVFAGGRVFSSDALAAGNCSAIAEAATRLAETIT